MKVIAGLLLTGKLGKMLLTVGTMAPPLFAYAQLYGWRYAAGFIGLIFIHEMGHAVALWQQGIPAGAPVVIPFAGAVLAMRGVPRERPATSTAASRDSVTPSFSAEVATIRARSAAS